MPTDEDFDELKATVAALKQELTTTKARLSEVEDFAQTHIGMDWGQAGISANVAHPNISADTIEYGGGVGRLTHDGQAMISTDSGDALAAVVTGAAIEWFRDNFTGTKIGEIGGGYSTPSTFTFHNMVMRAMANADGANSKVGVWDESTGDWSLALTVQDSPAVGDVFAIFSTTGGQVTTTQYLRLAATAADTWDLKVLRAGVLTSVAYAGGLLTDTAWAAAGDLVYGTGNDTATILSHPGSAGLVLTSTTAPNAMTWATPAGGSFSYGKAITTSQGQNLP